VKCNVVELVDERGVGDSQHEMEPEIGSPWQELGPVAVAVHNPTILDDEELTLLADVRKSNFWQGPVYGTMRHPNLIPLSTRLGNVVPDWMERKRFDVKSPSTPPPRNARVMALTKA
jgi:hypothetical protein